MKILIPAYTGLGNFILKTPMIKKIKELYPNAEIDILAGNSFGAEFVLGGSSMISKTLILDENASIKEKVSFFNQLKNEHYNAIFLPFDVRSMSLLLLSYFAGIKMRVVHFFPQRKKGILKFAFIPKTISVPILQGRHEIDLNYDLLEAYYNEPFTRQYDTCIHHTENKNILHKFDLAAKKYIVLQIGAANGSNSAKKWDIDNFEQLIKILNKEFKNIKIVTVGDKGDYEKDISKLENKGLNFINTAGLTTIDEVSSILLYSKLVVAHDSGIMHIANALNCNLIALYGPTDFTRTLPMSENTEIIYSKNKYFASMYNFKASEFSLPYPDSMDAIKIEMVLNTIRGKLNEP